MEEQLRSVYIKRTQKDYSLSLKLQIVKEVESGESTISTCRKKYGNFDWENQRPYAMEKTPEQRIMELEAEVKLLEKQKAFLEKQAYIADKKAIFFDMMIDLAEKEYRIDIRKNSPPEQSMTSAVRKKKL
ncbi:hypothetical protein [Chryseobacterium sp. G0186]|uniref:hypothetical protein n=1 Tax=Chryseobacterium sp. G0186 TaxID=2487064 RepID=UPI001E578D7F|nr:hypothetical protein [Chryseobacterium sp. G0186]